MQPAEEEQDALVSKVGVRRQESLTLQRRVAGRLIDSQADYGFPRLVGRERGRGEASLFLAGIEHGSGIAKSAVLESAPIKRLLGVLAGIALPEPWIQRPVDKKKIRHSGPAARRVHRLALVLPDAMDGHGVIVRRVPPQPKSQM